MKIQNLALAVLLLPASAIAARQPAVARALPETSKASMRSGAPRAPEQLAVTFEKAELGFKVDPKQRSLAGDAQLTFLANRAVDALVVDFDRIYRVEQVEVDGMAVSPDQWSNPDGRMRVQLPQPLAAGGRVVLRIRYAGEPHVAKRAPWDGGVVWATAPTGEPWIASAVQGSGCDLLWPCIDHPQGKPLLVEQHITVPAPLVAVSNGILLGQQEHDGWITWNWRARQPTTYAIALNIGPFEELKADYHSRYGNTIPMQFWYLRGSQDKARDLFTQFAPMLDFFEETIGPYPFGDEKMGVVETPHLGMEHQTINAYGNGYKKDEYGYDWLLQHEFAHEWFGNQLSNASWNDFWLHEGFGSYMQPLYLQWLRGDMEYYAALMKQRAAIVNHVPVVRDVGQSEELPGEDEEQPGLDVYYKGSLMLHTLRGMIGDEAFFNATRKLVYGTDKPVPGRFEPRHARTEDFIAAVNAATGRDYRWFFDVYLYSAPLPRLVATRNGGRLQLRWQTAQDKPFPMPVQVRVGDKVREVAMRDGSGSVAVGDGQSWTLDPHSKVLRQLDHIDQYQIDAKARKEAEAAKTKAAENAPRQAPKSGSVRRKRN